MGNRSWDREMRCRIDLNPCLDNGIDYSEKKKVDVERERRPLSQGSYFLSRPEG